MRYTSRGLVLVLALTPALCASSQPVVTVGPGGEVSVAADRAPIGEVLERFSRATGAELIWEGAPPRQLVSLKVQAPNAAAALAAILEGLALDYALALDATSSKVATLIVGGQAAANNGPLGAVAARPTGPALKAEPQRRPPPAPEAEPEPLAEPEEPPGEEPPATEPNAAGNRRPEGEVPGAERAPTPTPTPQGPFSPIVPQRYPTSPFNPQMVPPTFPLAKPTPTP